MAGNEQADQLAKEGAQTDQPNNPMSYKEKVSIIKAAVTKPKQGAGAYHHLNTADQVVMVNLRSVHTQLAKRTHVQKIQASTVSNLPMWGRRPNSRPYPPKMQNTTRSELVAKWPTETSLHCLLCGDIDDLMKTISFIADTDTITKCYNFFCLKTYLHG